jgi:hypothetical protein
MENAKRTYLANLLGHSTIELDVIDAVAVERTARGEYLDFSLIAAEGPDRWAVVRLSGELDNLQAWFNDYYYTPGSEEFEFYLV